jgi:hypothetical protein
MTLLLHPRKRVVVADDHVQMDNLRVLVDVHDAK